MSPRGEVLVAILNNQIDFNTAYKQHWYRISANIPRKIDLAAPEGSRQLGLFDNP